MNCLVTGGSKNDTAPMAVLLMNLRDTQSWIDHVVIYHDGISAKDQKLMQQIMPVEFIRYRFPGNTKTFNEIVRYVYTEMVFCKYECFKLLEKYDHIVWSDYDVVFLKDVPELVADDGIGIKSLMYDSDDPVGSFRDQLRGYFWKNWAGKLDLNACSIATGLFSLSRNLNNPERLYQRSIAVTEQYGPYLVLPEQAVLNIIFQENHISVVKIPWSYAFRPQPGEKNPDGIQILHAVSQPKFWNGLYNETWQKNYDSWLQMGGTPWKKEFKYSLKNIRKKILFFKNRFFHSL